MSKKSFPTLYSKLQHNMGQDFLDVQYCLFTVSRSKRILPAAILGKHHNTFPWHRRVILCFYFPLYLKYW